MASSFRLWLVVVALMAGALLVACGGNGDDGDDEDTDQPTATAVVDQDADADADGDADGDADADADGDADADEDEDEGNGIDAGDDAFDDIPLPAGADEISTLTISGSELPFAVPPGTDIDVSSYGEVTMILYEVDDSPGDIIDFYKDRRGDWDEAFSVSTDEGGFLVWTKDDGARAVWIMTTEGDDGEATTLTIIAGGLDD